MMGGKGVSPLTSKPLLVSLPLFPAIVDEGAQRKLARDETARTVGSIDLGLEVNQGVSPVLSHPSLLALASHEPIGLSVADTFCS